MNPQALMDGLLTGAMIGLGAIGVTLTYSILRFANFAHGEFIAWGAYFAFAASGALGYFSAISRERARGTVSAFCDDHAGALAGTQPHV